MISALIIYNSFLVLLTIFFLVILTKTEDDRKVERSILLIIAHGSILFLGSIMYPIDGFGRIQLLAWGVFLHLPLFLFGSRIILGKSKKIFGSILIVLSVLIVVVAVDSFLVEPQHLEVNNYTLSSPKLDQSLKLILLADIQTDLPGRYEEEILAITAAENPDLILFAGDYLQISDPEEYKEGVNRLNSILTESQLGPALGMFAVRGNVDHNDWESLFDGLDVSTFQTTTTLDLGPIALTGVSWRDSEDPGLSIEEVDPYHIVLGHSPNFSLGDINADLLLAGHTHGGQFQIPGIGPILTLSAVPRDWASGLTEIHSGQYLLVSRGIGLERGYSPRMRFFCRPELVIINLLPME